MATSEATPSSASIDPHQEVASKEITLGPISKGDTVASTNQGNQTGHVVAFPGANIGITTNNHHLYGSSAPENKLQKFLQSLRVTDPRDDLGAIRRAKGKKVKGTCEWLLDVDEYHTWEQKDRSQLLRVQGGPGIGKTMISSFLVDKLEEKERQDSTMTLAYYFCDNKDENRNTASVLLRGLLFQLLGKRSNLFTHAEKDYDVMKDRLPELFENLDTLWRIFRSMLKDRQVGKVYILVDALDECEKLSREVYLDHLRNLFAIQQLDGNTTIKFLITCRPELEIDETLRNVGGCLSLNSAKISADLSQFIDHKVDELPSRYPIALKQKIKAALKKSAGGTFLWASLVLDDISKTKMTSKVMGKLQQLPPSLGEVYKRILNNIDNEYREEAMLILQWVVIARRPLTVRELAMARALHLPEWENDIPPADILDELNDDFRICEPLLYRDTESDTINLVHQSVKDYLLGEDLQKNGELSHYHMAEDKTNLLIFQICWKYLSMEEFERGNKIISRRQHNMLEQEHLSEEYLQAHCLLRYTSQEWQEHAVAAGPALVTNCEFKMDTLDKVPTLRDSWLLRAAKEGQEVVVRLLLENGAEPDARNDDGQTLLSKAAGNGHEAVVKLLLAKDGVDVNSKHGFDSRTPLLWAAANGHEAVVKLLLAKDGVGVGVGVDVDSKDYNSRTPLLWAAANGHEAVVKLLLAKDGVDVDSKHSFDSRTPLSWAAANGHEAVVKLLLAKDGIDVDSKDCYDQTPLSYAVENGHEAVVKLLLAKDGIDVDSKDRYNQTPLLYAIENGHEAVVKLLLAKDGVDVDSKDGYNSQTPLSWAAANGHEAVVKLLLEKDGVDVNSKHGYYNRTPLLYAVENGHETVVKLLLAKDSVDVDSKDYNNQTPLSNAAANGDEAVVKLLLAKDGVDVDSKDCYNQTPLSYAVANGHEAVVKLLLLWAAANRHEAVVELLLVKDGPQWSDAAVIGRRERARGGSKAAASKGRRRRRRRL